MKEVEALNQVKKQSFPNKEFQKFYLYKSSSASFFSSDKEFEKIIIDLDIYEQPIFQSFKNNVNYIFKY